MGATFVKPAPQVVQVQAADGRQFSHQTTPTYSSTRTSYYGQNHNNAPSAYRQQHMGAVLSEEDANKTASSRTKAWLTFAAVIVVVQLLAGLRMFVVPTPPFTVEYGNASIACLALCVIPVIGFFVASFLHYAKFEAADCYKGRTTPIGVPGELWMGYDAPSLPSRRHYNPLLLRDPFRDTGGD